jgi:type I restriction enzyme S subunit
MVGDWVERPLAELTDNFDGTRVPVKEADRSRGPYPYYGASGVVDRVDGYLFDGEYLLIAEDGENLRTRNTPIAFLARGKFWVNNHAHIVRGNGKADTRFLMYALMSADISGYLTGSTMPKLTQGNLNRIPLLTPPLAEQRAIAHILGTLDDKIELNRKMSETLEAMARALFKSWFVDFDPVRAKMEGRDPGMPKEIADLFPSRMVESELGEIPEGWEVAAIGEHMANFDSRRVPVSGAERAKRSGPYPYHGAAGVMDHVDEYLFDGIHLLVGEDGSVVQNTGMAVTQYVWGKIWVNNHAHVLQGAGAVSTEQLYLYFHFEPVAPYVTGAVQPKLSQGRMNVMPFVYGGDAVCRAFGRTVKPWFERLRAAADEVRTLSELRNALLPKLISGELQLKDAEKIAERAA